MRRTSYLACHLTSLRVQRDITPGQLAACLGARNVSKVGSLIHAFERGDPLSEHWLEKLFAELKPNGLSCSFAWRWIRPRQTSSRWPLARGDEIREVPWHFCNSREEVEGWAPDQLRRTRAVRTLSWTRREQTCFAKSGTDPRRSTIRFNFASSGE